MNINAENEASFSISDAQGRSLMSGILSVEQASSLLTWSCNVPDTTETINSKIYLTSLSVDALGNTSKSRSNALGHTVQSVDQGGNISTVQYDAGGNAIVSRDPNNVGQDCVYDPLGRRTSCTDTVASLTQTGYDKSGQQITATDAKNKVTHYAFDARGRRWKETDRLTYPTEWSYDPSGNLLSLKDAENQITAYTYNDAGQRVTEKYPDHITGATIGTTGYGIITFGYDALGRRISKQDQQGDITSYNFDKSGRMLTRGYVGYASSLSPLSGQTNTDTFTYDRAGRMLSGIKGRYNNTVTFTYDDRGQQTHETLTTHGQTYTVGYQKNALGQTTQLQYPDGSLVNRAYTNRGQLQSVNYTAPNVAATSVATFTYDPAGRETSRNLGNGLTTTRSYFADNQIQTIATPTVETLTYTYDPNKNPTSETRSGVMAPYSWVTGPTGYDDEERLTNWSRNNGDSQSWNLSPVHDWNSTTINGTVQTRTHGPAHEILTMSGAGVSPSPATLTHDVKGNMTIDDRGTGMIWDFDNMLQTFTANGVSGLSNATYEYDAIGRRVAKNVAQSGGGTATTLFVQAGQQVTSEYTSGNTTTDCDRKYAYGSYIDEVLSFVDATTSSEQRHWLNTDRMNSAIANTALSSQIVSRSAYDPYGHRIEFSSAGLAAASPATPGLATAFTGRVLDSESLSLFYRSRSRSTTLGQFRSRDAIGYIDGRGLYIYTQSSPLRRRDPLGFSSKTKCVPKLMAGAVAIHETTPNYPNHVTESLYDIFGLEAGNANYKASIKETLSDDSLAVHAENEGYVYSSGIGNTGYWYGSGSDDFSCGVSCSKRENGPGCIATINCSQPSPKDETWFQSIWLSGSKPYQVHGNDRAIWAAVLERAIVTSGVSEVAQVDWSGDTKLVRSGGYTIEIGTGAVISANDSGSTHGAVKTGTSRSWMCECWPVDDFRKPSTPVPPQRVFHGK